MSGKPMSRHTACGRCLRASISASAPRVATIPLKPRARTMPSKISRELGVVLGDQHHPIRGGELGAVVGDRLRTRHRRRRGGELERRARRVARLDLGQHGRAGVRERQVERERAALARNALQAYLAAEQLRELAADRETKARAAMLARRAGVGLLERLEHDPLLVERNADARVVHRERDHERRVVEHRLARRPTVPRDVDAQRHAAAIRELERVRRASS